MAECSDFLSTLRQRPIVGDGSYMLTLERRGYTMAGQWTPEVVVEHPDAVLALHREFLRAGADVLQAFTFHATEGRLKLFSGQECTTEEINQAACDLIHQLKAEGHKFFTCGGISPTPTYAAGGGKEKVQIEFRKQTEILVKNKVDFLLGEFFGDVEQAEWSIEVMKESSLPVACTMTLGPNADNQGVSPGDCALRMARAGADILGLNCQYDPFTSVKVIKMMKSALDNAGLSPVLMIQALGFHCPDAENLESGYHDLPEYPIALEPRVLTRSEVRQFVREAYDAGVRYIGGCCGFESYHIRSIADELEAERGFRMPGADKWAPWGEYIKYSGRASKRVGKEYWSNLQPGTGRVLKPEAVMRGDNQS